MDLICPRCSEPYDALELQDTFTTAEKADFKAGRGCSPGCRRQPPVRNLRTMAAGALMEVMGDDLDGVASTLDDFDYLGMLDG